MRRIFFTSFLLVLAVQVQAQDFEITRLDLAGDKFVIAYNLTDTVRDRHYTIHVYSSRDNFLNPLQQVTGDAGLEIAPGPNKTIVWNAGKELGADFSGRVALEIRGRQYVPFVRLTSFEDTKTHKRGVPFTVTWTGGTRQNVLNFDLYQGDAKVWTHAGVGNTGHCDIVIPKKVRPGSYRFRISDSKNSEDVVFSSEFLVKRQFPLVIPIAVAAGAGYLIYELLDKPKTEGLVNPPCPDGGDECNN